MNRIAHTLSLTGQTSEKVTSQQAWRTPCSKPAISCKGDPSRGHMA
jgi:hypothetical protein